MADETWSKWSHSEWHEFEIPEGMEVIGLKARHSNYEMIQRIGFILWKPPATAVAHYLADEVNDDLEGIENEMVEAAKEESNLVKAWQEEPDDPTIPLTSEQ